MSRIGSSRQPFVNDHWNSPVAITEIPQVERRRVVGENGVMLDDLVEPLAEWELGVLWPEEVPGLAVAALERGCELREVAVLAGLERPVRADVDEELGDLLRRIGWARPTRDQALKTVVDALAGRIGGGSVEPADGAHRLWRLANQGGFGGPLWTQLAIFVGLASEWDDHEESRPAIEAQIVEEAQALVAAGGLRLAQG